MARSLIIATAALAAGCLGVPNVPPPEDSGTYPRDAVVASDAPQVPSDGASGCGSRGSGQIRVGLEVDPAVDFGTTGETWVAAMCVESHGI
jgi:hypothetical protein